MARTSNKSADMVTVACKLPQGLTIPLPDGTSLTLHGINSPFAIAGYGMTDVQAGVWAIVEAEYADKAWLKNEIVFAMGDKDSAVDKATERQSEKSGFEPVDPLKPGNITPAA